jgi:PAS domain-containing protein
MEDENTIMTEVIGTTPTVPVSESKNTESAGKSQAHIDQLQAMLSSTTDLLVFLNPQLACQSVNQAYMKAFELDCEAVSGAPMADHFDADVYTTGTGPRIGVGFIGKAGHRQGVGQNPLDGVALHEGLCFSPL